ncbi:hypothetical protein E4U55_005075 [Claviceps digitariae]|nr:hypothetical protein E4U55_005075 [Claviceps digitariae]
MPTIPEVSQARTEPHNPSRGSTREHRRGRGGRNRPRVSASSSGGETRTPQSDASRLQASSIAAPIAALDWSSGSSRRETSNRGSRGRKRQSQGQRQSRRDGAASHNVTRPPAQRAFGGHLTRARENNSDGRSSVLTGSLSGDAPEFVPGQLVVPRTNLPNSGPPTQLKIKPPKSTADDLGLRIHEDIVNLNYECAILCNESLACTAKAAISCPCGLRQQQVKCLASSLTPTPPRPDIKCDEECLRLERNRRLAAALNIDPASHQNDHVPYADLTLKLFMENTSWAESQEREFRVFAKSPNEVRLRFKPMISTYRQFLHNLATDYGLESKSEDTEPHRYVVVFKGVRFVSAPLKTLAQCVKIRAAQAAEAAASSTATSRALPHVPPRANPFNGFLLINPRFGLTIDEVTSALQSDLAVQPSIHFKISFLPSEEILLYATTSYSAVLSPTALEQVLTSMKARLAKSIEAVGLAGNILLCHVDSSSNHIIHRDDFNKTDASGWSAVAGRSAAKLESVLPAEEPVSRKGKLLIGIRKKQSVREKSWTEQLDGDVEC